jgi:energy-coupling factor transport system permease protein
MSVSGYLYSPRNNWSQRVDTRVKMLFVAACWTVLFAAQDLALTLAILASLHILYVLSQIPDRIVTIWKAFLPILISIPILWALFYPDGVPLFAWGWLEFKAAGFLHGLGLALRLVSLAFALLFWFYTTDPDTMLLGLVKLKIPYEWGLIFILALQYIPAFQALFRTILEAQQARGLVVAGSGFGRVRRMMPIFVALVISILRFSDHLAKALESRAFGAAGIQRTFLHEIRFQPLDYLLTAAILAGTIAMLAGL